jgi:hypothetical protein
MVLMNAITSAQLWLVAKVTNPCIPSLMITIDYGPTTHAEGDNDMVVKNASSRKELCGQGIPGDGTRDGRLIDLDADINGAMRRAAMVRELPDHRR